MQAPSSQTEWKSFPVLLSTGHLSPFSPGPGVPLITSHATRKIGLESSDGFKHFIGSSKKRMPSPSSGAARWNNNLHGITPMFIIHNRVERSVK